MAARHLRILSSVNGPPPVCKLMGFVMIVVVTGMGMTVIMMMAAAAEEENAGDVDYQSEHGNGDRLD